MSTELRLRTARVEDGAEVWRLVRDSGGLDLNSSYAYLLVCDRFGDTCLLAETGDALAGFVMAFRPPRDPDVIFVWQIGVAASARGLGVGRKLLLGLLELDACRGVRFLETTITPSNEGSEALFRSFARHAGAETVEVSGGYPTALFPDGKETERLFRIGPLKSAAPSP
jgi:L-2,4-diaminobutyric acid acetyltransferase